MDIRAEYDRWIKNASDEDIRSELLSYTREEIENSFYKNLEFGTGGLRGVIGAGTNKINIYTVAKASQGLANYLIHKYGHNANVAIGYDSRNKSDIFAKTAASVFAANGLSVWIWPRLNPVPTVSFAVRNLALSAGVMITASHNPAKYNGYKVYGSDGCQITTEVASAIFQEIESLDIFGDVKKIDFKTAVDEGQIKYIVDSVLTEFIDKVKAESVLFGDSVDKNIAIVYSPLNGSGYIPVTRALAELGYSNVSVVEEQRLPDGNFTTCPYPNPEIKEAMRLAIDCAREKEADLVLATDPDCDRVGVAVRYCDEYILISGNEMGILLLDYICSQRVTHNRMPDNPLMIKTIVTTDLGTKIASSYGVRTIDVLTGFKFIGEQIGFLEAEHQEENYIFGFEESYGYLSGTYVRDKDGVNGVCLISEMFAFYKTRGVNLLDKLEELYRIHGFCLNSLHRFEFDGASGNAKIKKVMEQLRDDFKVGDLIAGERISGILDYSEGIEGLPKSNVIKYIFEDGSSMVARPSGTEPLLKLYFSINASTRVIAESKEEKMKNCMENFVGD